MIEGRARARDVVVVVERIKNINCVDRSASVFVFFLQHLLPLLLLLLLQ